MSETKTSIFEIKIFKRLFVYTKPYRFVFYGLLSVVLLLGFFSVAIPKLLTTVVDEKIAVSDENGFVDYILIMLGLIILEAIFQFLFSFYSSWLGQHMIKDLSLIHI